MKIDGVEYKFKEHVKHSTNKRFVGYIAQQIESVVPEAVQLIDGILHVDYESLIPYLSESIKQNFNDIKGLKTESVQFRQVLDKMYAEFIAKHSPHCNKNEKTRATAARGHWKWLLIAGLVCLIGATVGILLLLNQPSTDNYKATPIAIPIAQINPAIHTNTDRDVLIKLFNAWNGSHWINSKGWGTNSSHCYWKGIVCNKNEGVRYINLANNNLVGTIPEELALLEQLERLDLSSNDLRGTIPDALWSLANLTELSLGHNKNLGGTISTAIGRATKLHSLSLWSCTIQGTLPLALEQLPSLETLDLSNNSLSGTIPALNMSIILLAYNQFSGTIPDIFFSSTLDLSNNKLTGGLSRISATPRRKPSKLNVSHNELDGNFFLAESLMRGLVQLDISNNKFNRSELDPAYDLVELYSCDAANNRFHCPIPEWLKARCNATCS